MPAAEWKKRDISGRRILAEYAAEEVRELPIVAISDGARSIKCGVKRLFAEQVSHLLDWYHLEAKVYQLMTQIAPNKQVKEEVQEQIINCLWHGATDAAIKILEAVKARAPSQTSRIKRIFGEKQGIHN